ncbi:MAG: amidase [Alphaproteobacteria bacterium HGW-Alphaproteobacteria-16]|nr:MAG: amidase [Alphaproteobacteria bacterium HGW-Alphaproteobacteria-16]
MSDWHRQDIAGLTAAYRSGVGVCEVVEHHLSRIGALDGQLRSFIQVDTVGSLRDAVASQARFDAGNPRALEGVPVAVKANIAVAGLDWNAGMGARRGVVAHADAVVVQQLRAAGAIILGTLNMHEAALGATSDNPFFGRVTNPHDVNRTPGGSSGGSGAAVAAGLCTVSLGTDTMGSVRIPAAYNGVFGLKPGHGVVSADGLVPASVSLDAIGPLARSLDDLAAVFAVIGEGALGGVPARLLTLDPCYGLECEAAIDAAVGRARAVLSGMQTHSVRLADDAAAVGFAGFVQVARELAGHLADTPSDGFSDELRFMLGHAAKRSDAEVAEAAAVLARTRTTLRDAIGTDGVLLTATAPQVAFAHTNRPPVTQSGFTALANIAGLPAISIPAGQDADGLPVAVQLIGAPGSDTGLIALARRIDAELHGYFPPAMLTQGDLRCVLSSCST